MAREITVASARPPRRIWTSGGRTPHAPRFVVRVLATSFLTVVAVLAAVSTVLVLQTRVVVERGITDDLEAAQRQLAASERERQQDAVLRATLIAISRTLKISPQTLRNHLHHINDKLRTHNRLEAVTHAQRRGLIE